MNDMNDNRNIATDFDNWAYPNGMNARQRFFERGLPWIVLVAIISLLAMLIFTSVSFLDAILEPLSLGFKEMGL